MVAVHPKKFYVNGWNNPILPFGTTILPDEPLTHPLYGYTMYTFKVEDTGELDNEHNLTTYWFDIWSGLKTSANDETVRRWGTHIVNYTAIY